MAVDMRRIAIAAVDAAFDQVEESKKKKRRGRLLSPKRAVLGGAALVTAGRVAWSGRGRGLLDSLEDRLSGFEDDHGPSQVHDEVAEDFEEEDEFDEPEAEQEPESYDEEEEEPEDFENDDFESEDAEDYGDDPDEDVGEEEATRRRPKAGTRTKRRS